MQRNNVVAFDHSIRKRADKYNFEQGIWYDDNTENTVE